MDLDLRGKVAVVTGGASNVGRGITLGFVKEGARVAIAEVDIPQGEKVLREAQSLGEKPLLIEADVTDQSQVERMVEQVFREFGQIDILINNAGWCGAIASFLEKSRGEWKKEMDVNLWGTVNCCRAVIPRMVEMKSGKIVNISSDAGRVGEYHEEIYSAAKGAIIALSKSLAKGFARYGITVNVVCPGATYSESPDHYGEMSLWNQIRFSPESLEKQLKKYPLRKFGKPEDISNAVLFLSSDVAGQITGQTLSVNGGYSMI